MKVIAISKEPFGITTYPNVVKVEGHVTAAPITGYYVIHYRDTYTSETKQAELLVSRYILQFMEE